MDKLKRYLKPFRNFYVVVGGTALIMMLFFDRYNLISRVDTHFRIRELQSDLAFYKQEKQRLEAARVVLENDETELERFAREQYRMKKDDEDLFIIVEE